MRHHPYYVKGDMIMFRCLSYSAAVLVLMSLCVLLTGCKTKAPVYSTPVIDVEAVAQALVEQYGSNGKISGAEIDKFPALKSTLVHVDKNEDGSVTPEELATRMEKWRRWIGRLPYDVRVARKVPGAEHPAPIEGATVKFIPEKALQPQYQTITAITDKEGWAGPTVPLAKGETTIGIPAGFYRIEITKEGENIPAEYNTNTKLGCEVHPLGVAEKEADFGKNKIFILDY
jgi:hypothetical protein